MECVHQLEDVSTSVSARLSTGKCIVQRNCLLEGCVASLFEGLAELSRMTARVLIYTCILSAYIK